MTAPAAKQSLDGHAYGVITEEASFTQANPDMKHVSSPKQIVWPRKVDGNSKSTPKNTFLL